MLRILRSFDGKKSLGEIAAEIRVDGEAMEAFSALRAGGALVDPQSPNTPGPRREGEACASLAIFPTTACNLRCTYCYARCGESPRKIPPPIYRAAIDYFLARCFDKVTLAALVFHGGGEATTAFPLIRQIGDYFKEQCNAFWLKPRFRMQSNGTFGPGVRGWIQDNDVEVGISFDGPAEVHNRQRPFRNGKPSFDRVTENIRSLVDAGRDVGIISTVAADSLAAMPETVELAHRLGIETLGLGPLYTAGRSLETGLRPPDPEAYAERFLACFRRGLELNVSVVYLGLSCMNGGAPGYCGAGGGTFAVTPGGTITTCYEALDDADATAQIFHVGKVDGESGEVRIDEEKLGRLGRRTPESIPACSSCFLRLTCAGGCVLRGVRTHRGDLLGVHTEGCRMHRAINRQIVVWLADGAVRPLQPSRRTAFRFTAAARDHEESQPGLLVHKE